jgi:hypothetical protein
MGLFQPPIRLLVVGIPAIFRGRISHPNRRWQMDEHLQRIIETVVDEVEREAVRGAWSKVGRAISRPFGGLLAALPRDVKSRIITVLVVMVAGLAAALGFTTCKPQTGGMDPRPPPPTAVAGSTSTPAPTSPAQPPQGRTCVPTPTFVVGTLLEIQEDAVALRVAPNHAAQIWVQLNRGEQVEVLSADVRGDTVSDRVCYNYANVRPVGPKGAGGVNGFIRTDLALDVGPGK